MILHMFSGFAPFNAVGVDSVLIVVITPFNDAVSELTAVTEVAALQYAAILFQN